MFGFTKGDKVVVFLVLVSAIIVYFAFAFAISDTAPQKVEVYVDGDLYGSYDLSKIGDEKILDIKTGFGNNVLKITPDGAEMIYTDCPDKMEVKLGKITKAGQMLICAPNRVSVRMIGKNNREVDRVTY